MKDFYKGKKVFLTGHTGFKGTWASLMLKQLGAEVHGFSLPPEDTRGNLFNMVNLPGLINSSEFGDVTNANTLSTAVKRVQPDIIFHMAAQAFVRRSYNDPATNYASNVMGTVNIFEAARALTANSTKPLILLNVTTDKCYENIETTEPYIETDRIGGHDPYSTSKACSELITASYQRTFFNDGPVYLASARAGNVIGGGDFSEDRLIPDIIDSIKTNKTVKLRYPNSVRPWQHVMECISGYLHLIAKLGTLDRKYCSSYNIGPNTDEKRFTVEDITKIFIETAGKGSYEIETQKPQLHEAGLLLLNNNKAKRELNWLPKYSTKEAIEISAKWYAEYLNNSSSEKLLEFTNSQISDYLNAN